MSDEEDIRRLIASYAQLVDDRKYDDWTNLFTPNGTFKPGSGEPRVGHDAIRSYIHAGHGAQPERRTKHLAFNSIIEVHGEEATAVSDYFVFARIGDQGQWTASTSGRHDDRLVKVKGRWLFAERINRSGA